MRGRLRFLLALFLLFFPSALLPGRPAWLQFTALALFTGAILAATALAERLPIEAHGTSNFIAKSFSPAFLALTVLALIVRLPLAGMPVEMVSDAQIHQGLPAVVWAQLTGRLHLYNRAAVILLLWLLVFIVYHRREALKSFVTRFGTVSVWLGCAVSAAVLLAWHLPSCPGHDPLRAYLPPEKLVTLQRYPPLGKILTFLGYALFGINEAVQAGIQTAFTIMTAAILASWGHRLRKGAGLVVATGWLFAPIFLSPVYLGHLESGTVFFITTSLHFALRLLDRPRRDDHEIYLAVFFAGLLYKELQLLAFPLVFLAVLLSPLDPVEKRDRGLALLGPPLLVGLPYLLLSRLGNSPSGMAWEALRHPSTLVPTIAPIIWGLGAVIGILGLIGLLLLVRQEPELRTRITALWLLVGVLFLWSGLAWSYLRHSSVFLPPVVLGLAGLVPPRITARTSILIALLVAAFSCANLFARSSELVTFGNFDVHYLPYEEAIRAIPDGATVYAPMIVEPSHFYLAKTGKLMTLRYERDLWYEQNRDTPRLADLLAEADRLAAEYLLLPRPLHPIPSSPHALLVAGHRFWREHNPGRSGGEWDVGTLPPDLDRFLQNPGPIWRVVETFRFGQGELVLLAREGEYPDNATIRHDEP